MLKPLTLSLSLAVAFGLSSLSLAAGHHDSSSSCALPSAQGAAPAPAAPSAQALPSAQETCGGPCEAGPRKKCRLLEMFKHRPKCYTYEWVLVKKRVRHGLCGGGCGGGCGGCGDVTCESCGAAMPSAQGPSPQGGYPAPQSFGAPQALYTPTTQSYSAPLPLSTGQAGAPAAAHAAPTAMPAPTPAPVDPSAEPPRMPEEPKQADAGGLLLLNPSGL